MFPVIDSAAARFQPSTGPDWGSPGTDSLGGGVRGFVDAVSSIRTEARAVPSQPTTARIPYLDMARGLFLILMASSHAMTLAGIPGTSPLARWGLPRGWAATGLIMLSGFMVATFCREMEDRARIRARVLRRAKQVFIVMFASNVLMVPLRHFLTRDAEPLFTVAWWWNFLFRGADWSISGILLPIGSFLLLSPGLIQLRDACRSRIHHAMFAAGVMVVVAVAWSVTAFAGDGLTHHHALDMLFGSGVGGFPIIPIIASGALGFLVGTVWQPVRDRFDARTMLGIALFFITAGQLASVAPVVVRPILARTVVDASHFLVIIALAVVLIQWRPSRRALRFVSVLGGASLLTFLLHRIVEHALNLSLKPFDAPMEVVYAVCLTGGVTGSAVLIGLRRRFAAYDRFLRAVYL